MDICKECGRREEWVQERLRWLIWTRQQKLAFQILQLFTHLTSWHHGILCGILTHTWTMACKIQMTSLQHNPLHFLRVAQLDLTLSTILPHFTKPDWEEYSEITAWNPKKKKNSDVIYLHRVYRTEITRSTIYCKLLKSGSVKRPVNSVH